MKDALRFCAKWLAALVVVSVAVFALSRLMPGSPVERLLSAANLAPTQENVDALTREWGLDRPLPEQYLTWASNFVRGDWGRSMVSRLDIRQELLSKLPCTLAIGFGGLGIGAVGAFLIGYGAALRPGGAWDRVSRGLSVLSQTVPPFILAFLVIYVLGVRLQLVRFFTGAATASVVIAALIVSLDVMGGLSRVALVRFREQEDAPYVRFALARGFPRPYVLLHHASRPVLYGLVSVLIARVPVAIGGTSVMEFAFSIPGISYFLIQSLQANDYYVLQSYSMLIMLVMLVTHATLNLVLRALDDQGREVEAA